MRNCFIKNPLTTKSRTFVSCLFLSCFLLRLLAPLQLSLHSQSRSRTLNRHRGRWSAVSCPAGSGAEPRPQRYILGIFWAVKRVWQQRFSFFLYEPKCCNWSECSIYIIFKSGEGEHLGTIRQTPRSESGLIRIRIPDQFSLRLAAFWRRFALSEHSLVTDLFYIALHKSLDKLIFHVIVMGICSVDWV